MPGNINDVIDVQGSITAIDKVADRLVNLEDLIEAVNKESVLVKVTIEGADTLGQIQLGINNLNRVLGQNTQAINETREAQTQLNQTQQIYGGNIIDNVSALVNQKLEMKYVSEQIKILTKGIQDDTNATAQASDQLSDYTLRQKQLQVELQGTNKAIKDQIVSNEAFQGSVKSARAEIVLLNREQENLIVVRRQGIAITDEELAANVKRRDAIIAEKNALHDFIKANADANLSRILNVGNYPTVSAELSHLRAEMQRLALAGERDSAEFQKMSIRANELSASMREVTRETGRATFSMENVGKRLETSIFRMGLHFAVFTLVIGGVMKLVEWMGKLSDAEELAKQKMDELAESTKAYAKTVSEMSANIASAQAIETEKSKNLVAIMTDMTQPIEARTDAYNKLLSTMPGLFHGMTQEQALSEKSVQGIREHAAAIIDLETKITETIKARDQAQKLLSTTIESQTAIERTYSGTAADPNKAKTETINKLTKEVKAYNNELSENAANLARINSPDIKENKLRDDSHKNFEAELAEEKAAYEHKVLLNQKAYDMSNKTFYEDKIRLVNEQALAEEHAAKMSGIIDKWHGKVQESDAKYNSRKQQAENDLLAVENATNEEQLKIAKTIQERHIKENAEIDALIIKWNEQKAAIKSVNDEIDLMNEKAKIDHKEASGINPLLAGLGIDIPDNTNRDRIKASIEKARKDLDDAKNKQLKESTSIDSTAERAFAATQDVADKTKSLRELEIQQEADDDAKRIEAKKKIGELAVQLAQQTADAIKTIRDNSFAAEQQQLEIEQRELQLHSQQKIQSIQATAGFQITKDNEIAKVTAQTAAQQNTIQQKQNELALKKAKADKQAAESGVLLNTALAIAKTLPMLADPLTVPFGIAEIALITAAGAAQYAAAESTPLPQFEEGTGEAGTFTRSFIAAEGNKRELGVTPSGEVKMFNKEGVYQSEIGTRIFSNPDTERIISYSVNASGNLIEYNPPTMTDKNIVEAVKENTEAVIKAALLRQPVRNNIVVNLGNPLQRTRK